MAVVPAARAIALSAALLNGLALPAPALPVEGRLVVSACPLLEDRLSANLGLDAEFGPREGAFSAGATGWVLGEPFAGNGLFRPEYAVTAFLRAQVPFTDRDELGVVLGHNYRYNGGVICPGFCAPPDSTWLILGLAWHHQTERYWLRFTPQYELTWDPRFACTDGPGYVGGWTSWALPWVEGGFWVTPTLGLGARIGPGIAQGVWRF